MEQAVMIYHSKASRLRSQDDKAYEFKKLSRMRLSEYPNISLSKKAVVVLPLEEGDGYSINVAEWYLNSTGKYSDHAAKVRLYLQQLDDEYNGREITKIDRGNG